jgi:hypothetical protein
MYKVKIQRAYRDLYSSDMSDMTQLYSIEEIRRFINISIKDLERYGRISRNKSIMGFSKIRHFDSCYPRFEQVYVEMVDMYQTMIYNYENEQREQEIIRPRSLWGNFVTRVGSSRGRRSENGVMGDTRFNAEYITDFSGVENGTINLDTEENFERVADDLRTIGNAGSISAGIISSEVIRIPPRPSF